MTLQKQERVIERLQTKLIPGVRRCFFLNYANTSTVGLICTALKDLISQKPFAVYRYLIRTLIKSSIDGHSQCLKSKGRHLNII